MTAFAVGLQEGVQDGRRSSRKAVFRDTVVAGSNELARTDTRLFLPGSALRSRLLRIRARGPQRTTGLSFCAALRCDSIENAAALQ